VKPSKPWVWRSRRCRRRTWSDIAAVEAFNAHDIEALIVLCDPSIEAYSVFAAVGGGVYHGYDGLRRFFSDAGDTWGDQIRIEPEAYFDVGEKTFVFYVLHGHGRQSGAEVTMPLVQLVSWRDCLGRSLPPQGTSALATRSSR
jgi:SnoaL-like domain